MSDHERGTTHNEEEDEISTSDNRGIYTYLRGREAAIDRIPLLLMLLPWLLLF